MEGKTLVAFGVGGAAAWFVAMVSYAVFGAAEIDSLWLYGINALVTALGFGLVFRGLAGARRLERRLWIPCGLAYALPGLLLNVVVFAGLGLFYAEAPAGALARFGGFMALVYLMLPLIAWPSPRDTRTA